MTTAEEWARALVTESLRPTPSPKRLARELGEYAWRSGDKDRNIPTVPNGGTVRAPFGDGIDYVACSHCGTHWPVNATRSTLEWCHEEHSRDVIRATVRSVCAMTGTDATKPTKWADRYYLWNHVRPGCNACQ